MARVTASKSFMEWFFQDADVTLQCTWMNAMVLVDPGRLARAVMFCELIGIGRKHSSDLLLSASSIR